MKLRKKIVRAVIIAGLMAILMLPGCGGSSDSASGTSDSTTGKTPNPSASSEQTSASNDPEANEASAEPSKEFVSKGRNGELAEIGKEASVAVREEASIALEKNLNAREAGDWETQCSTLAASSVEQVEKEASVLGAEPGCAKALETQAGPVPPQARANTMTGPIDAFRINQGINGFAFWHGTRGKDFVIPMIKQRGEWKVVTLQEEEIR